MSCESDVPLRPHTDSDQQLCGSSPHETLVYVDTDNNCPVHLDNHLDGLGLLLDNEQLHATCRSDRRFVHEGGLLLFTNFRICSIINQWKHVTVNIPFGLVDSVESKDLLTIFVNCKDGHVFRFAFFSTAVAQEVAKIISDAIEIPSEIPSFTVRGQEGGSRDNNALLKASNGYSAHQNGASSHSFLRPFVPEGGGHASYTKQLTAELGRMEFPKDQWDIFSVNTGFQTCATYPECHILPKKLLCSNNNTNGTISEVVSTNGFVEQNGSIETVLKEAAKFRASGRFPSVVWRHRISGAVLIRSSQPQSGIFLKRSNQDEDLLKSIATAAALSESSSSTVSPTGSNNSSPQLQNGTTPRTNSVESKPMLVLDARSYKAAFGNWVTGGGVENSENYNRCEVAYMNIANIHQVRKSLQSLRCLMATPGDAAFLSGLEATQWLSHVSQIIQSACCVARALSTGRSVLVHCSDGWDRTPQIVSLAELILDPFYRTLKGFQVLVDREWLAFGHRFSDRCGTPPLQLPRGDASLSLPPRGDSSERSPVFLQWLDCVYQLLRQFPTAFEFTESFLLKVVLHTYSNLYGTFMCSSLQERELCKVFEKTDSVWPALLRCEDCRNCVYVRDTEPVKMLKPAFSIRELVLWRHAYMVKDPSAQPPTLTSHTSASQPVPISRSSPNGNEREVTPPAIVNGNHLAASPGRLSESPDYVQIGTPSSTPAVAISPIAAALNGTAYVGSSSVTAVYPPGSDVGESDDDFIQVGEDTLPTLIDPVQKAARQHLAAARRLVNGGLSAAKECNCQSRMTECARETVPGASPREDGYVTVDAHTDALVPWHRDELYHRCSLCNSDFGYFRKKHHCRMCGHVFCRSCSDFNLDIPAEYETVRVCRTCFARRPRDNTSKVGEQPALMSQSMSAATTNSTISNKTASTIAASAVDDFSLLESLTASRNGARPIIPLSGSANNIVKMLANGGGDIRVHFSTLTRPDAIRPVVGAMHSSSASSLDRQ